MSIAILRLNCLALVGGLLVLSACHRPKYEFEEMPIGIGSKFELTGDDGARHAVLDSKLPVTALFFGFTRCPDVCPLTMHKMDSAVRNSSRLVGKFRLLFISVDSPREKPEDLRSFLAAFPYAKGFTGSKTEILELERNLGAYSSEKGSKLSHSLYIYLLDNQGKVIYLLRHDDPVDKILGVLEQAAG